MTQKWRTIAESLPPSSSSFRPQLSFAANINRPPLFPSNVVSHPIQARPFSRSSPLLQISDLRSICYRCGLEGHMARSCFFPARCFHCGANGHKRTSRPTFKTQKPSLSTAHANEDEGFVEAMVSRSLWSEPDESVDRFLLDPDVANDKLPNPKSPDGKLLDLDPSGKIRLVENHGSYNIGMLLGIEKGLGFSRISSFNQNLLLRCWTSKGKRAMDSLCQRNNVYPLGIVGKEALFKSKNPFLHSFFFPKPTVRKRSSEHAMVNTAPLEDCSSESSVFKALASSSSDGSCLPPAPFEAISCIVILDDLEDRLSEEDEDASAVFSPFEPESMKKAAEPSKKAADHFKGEKTGSANRDAVLDRVENEKKMSWIKAWEESEKAKAENKAIKRMSAITAWENSKKANMEAALKRNIERKEKRKAEYAEKVKNKMALVHKEAEEKRAMVEAKRAKDLLKAEELAAKYRATGLAPKNKMFGCFLTLPV